MDLFKQEEFRSHARHDHPAELSVQPRLPRPPGNYLLGSMAGENGHTDIVEIRQTVVRLSNVRHRRRRGDARSIGGRDGINLTLVLWQGCLHRG